MDGFLDQEKLDIKHFGSFLKSCRLKARLTQKDLSEKLGVSNLTLWRWENKSVFPSNPAILKRIADFFKIPFQIFVQLKKKHLQEHREQLILSSKYPVVSSSSVNYVPLLSENMKALPLEAVQNAAKWKRKKIILPADLFPGFIFAFEVANDSMEPDYRKGDVLLVDMRVPAHTGKVAVVKLKNQKPLFCFYFNDNHTKTLKTLNSKAPALKARRPDIEWAYSVIRHMPRQAN